MNLQNLCTNCLLGTLENGICTYCHKSVHESAAKRPAVCLPERYLLASRYYVGKVIGNGGFGITYLTWDCMQQKRVIVKELFPRLDVQRAGTGSLVKAVKGQEEYFEKLKQRFREEATILASFRKEPAVVDVYQLLEENNTVYYSMEYLSGIDLRTYMEQNGKVNWTQLSEYVRKLLYILKILHGQGLIHRDISPDNIFLTSTTEAKLIDFGSVRCYNNGQGLTTILKQAYAPIEQYFSNGNQGPWTDIYSLSVTIYHVLSGQRPPKAPDRIKRDGAIFIGELCPDLTGHVARAIMKGISVRGEDRFQSTEALAAELFPKEQTSGPRPYCLRAVSGFYKGRKFKISSGTVVTFGRDSRCDMVYPPNSPGVSRRQCVISYERGGLLIVDEHSTYGTMVSGYRLQPDTRYELRSGDTITFGNEGYVLE